MQKGYAVLGVLSLGPRSGYDIARDLTTTVDHFWHESYGQIYPILHQLVDARLATVQTYQQPGRPDRNEYAITQAGRDALLDWLAEPQAKITRPRNEVLLKLFFGSRVPPEISTALIQRYQADLRQRRVVFDQIEGRLRAEPISLADLPYWLATLRHGQLQLEALERWCDETLSMLRTLVVETQRPNDSGKLD
jgi:DNA-binding PadR family transcriptional regulator